METNAFRRADGLNANAFSCCFSHLLQVSELNSGKFFSYSPHPMWMPNSMYKFRPHPHLVIANYTGSNLLWGEVTLRNLVSSSTEELHVPYLHIWSIIAEHNQLSVSWCNRGKSPPLALTGLISTHVYVPSNDIHIIRYTTTIMLREAY